MLILAYVGKGIFNVMATLVVLEWAYYAHRPGQALVERRKEYVEAARGLACRPGASCAPHPAQLPAAAARDRHPAGGARHHAGGHAVLPRPGRAHHRALAGPADRNGYQYMLSGEYWISFFPASRW
jgi:peptide/nickel transport system permease protein